MAERKLPYREFRMESWDEFLKAITDSPFANWAFRGQCEGAAPLYTSLSRYFLNFGIHKDAWSDQEERILRIFKRKAHHHLNVPPEEDDDFQWLALMQHHSAPTRLLDFTWSPYVAAFFALSRAVSGDAAVWAVNPLRAGPAEKRTIEKGRAVVKPHRADPREKGNYRQHYLRGDSPVIWIGEPYRMNRRLIAQSGTFAMPGLLDRPLEEIFSEYPDPGEIMVKFVLPVDRIREHGLRELYRMNVTWATLFPDLDGLGRSLGYELEFHWGYNPRTMEPLL